MTKYYGKIGFIKTEESDPGVYVEKTIERLYKGEVIRNNRRWESSQDSINSNINVNNSISIVSDDFVVNNMPFIRYVEWMGSYWNINSIDVQPPRLVLEIGGVYNRVSESEESEDSTSTDVGEDIGQ